MLDKTRALLFLSPTADQHIELWSTINTKHVKGNRDVVVYNGDDFYFDPEGFVHLKTVNGWVVCEFTHHGATGCMVCKSSQSYLVRGWRRCYFYVSVLPPRDFDFLAGDQPDPRDHHGYRWPFKIANSADDDHDFLGKAERGNCPDYRFVRCELLLSWNDKRLVSRAIEKKTARVRFDPTPALPTRDFRVGADGLMRIKVLPRQVVCPFSTIGGYGWIPTKKRDSYVCLTEKGAYMYVASFHTNSWADKRLA
jgi:hypothetical protein